MTWLLSLLSGCTHSRMTFPQTKRRVTWVSCLSCGAEFSYDFQTMRMGARIHAEPESRALQVERLEQNA